MKELKNILFFFFPRPVARNLSAQGEVIQSYESNVDWIIFSSILLYLYFIFLSDLITYFDQKISFDDSFGFFLLNNHIAAFGSLTTMALSIFMLHFIARVQHEAPEDVGGRILFNFFLVFLLGITLFFKGKHIDPMIGESIVERYDKAMLASFKGDKKQKYISILKERLAKGKFEERDYHFEILCELGLVDGCASVAEIHSKLKDSKHYWSLKRALNLEPENTKVLNNLAWSMVTDNQYNANPAELSKALEYAQKAVELQPQNHYYNDTLAYILFKNNQCEKAQTYQFLAIKYLKVEVERKPSSELKNEYEQRLEMYKECKVDK